MARLEPITVRTLIELFYANVIDHGMHIDYGVYYNTQAPDVLESREVTSTSLQ